MRLRVGLTHIKHPKHLKAKSMQVTWLAGYLEFNQVAVSRLNRVYDDSKLGNGR